MQIVTHALAYGHSATSLALIGGCGVLGAALIAPLLRRTERAKLSASRSLDFTVAVGVSGVVVWLTHVIAIAPAGEAWGANFDLAMTGFALVVSLVMSAVGLSIASPAFAGGAPAAAALGGAIVGLSIAVVHFVGVAAVRAPGYVDVHHTTLLLAGVLAAAVSGIGFALSARDSWVGRLCGAALIGATALAYHVLVLASLHFTPDAQVAMPASAVSARLLLLCASLSALAVLALAFGAALADLRAANGEVDRDRTFADLTREGIVICADMRIVDVNVAAARLAGLDPSMMRGRAFRDFVDAPDPDRLLSATLAKPQEIALRTLGGESAWVEISSRDVAMQGRAQRVFTLRDLSEQRRKEHQIRHLAYHDPLTGLANRAAFNEALATALKRGGEVALFCVDLDKFKEVNDVFGHAAGDELLRTAARRIMAAASDAMTFRLGGDEFVVIGTGPDAGDADKLALRITERLNTETVIAGRTMRCGASVGFAVYPYHGANVDALFANADAALYRAKADGRGLARGFEPEMDLALRERRALQQDLATAVSRNEIFLHWMPQANTETGEIVGFEALVRWKHPTRGVVPPVQFIPVAEETAAIVPIGEWVLRTACREAMGWVKPGKVAVNLSPVQFQHGDIVDLVHSILLDTGLPARRLELEITEGVLLDDLNGALLTLRRLKALGVQIAMDDFGTGYSSLSYLQSFPFDRIKIDASFIRTLSTSPQAKAIVRAVVALGASLDMPITAEGVETPEQRAFLAELRCEEIQGYLVGRPSPVVSFDSVFAKQRMRAAG
ncbi:putative bifunctional diguanylate cyclase/phosphodiesterase [Hansschlegelia sp. KR7-227]|uniref:putative bifunctional diguanylate cyclase/phosphodiesterase n=1 Tax=Hansschlegelia sp. KR7-227 TaxID=3400914 RepID=UPI003BFB7B32